MKKYNVDKILEKQAERVINSGNNVALWEFFTHTKLSDYWHCNCDNCLQRQREGTPLSTRCRRSNPFNRLFVN